MSRYTLILLCFARYILTSFLDTTKITEIPGEFHGLSLTLPVILIRNAKLNPISNLPQSTLILTLTLTLSSDQCWEIRF